VANKGPSTFKRAKEVSPAVVRNSRRSGIRLDPHSADEVGDRLVIVAVIGNFKKRDGIDYLNASFLFLRKL
jgi:hypothetical protein